MKTLPMLHIFHIEVVDLLKGFCCLVTFLVIDIMAKLSVIRLDEHNVNKKENLYGATNWS